MMAMIFGFISSFGFLTTIVILMFMNSKITALEERFEEALFHIAHLKKQAEPVVVPVPEAKDEHFNSSYGDPEVLQWLDQTYDNKGVK